MNATESMRLLSETKYLQFFEGPPKAKTRTVLVGSKFGKCFLGEIAWYGPFRCYSFTPLSDTIYEHDCLRAIANVCERMTREHRARQKGA